MICFVWGALLYFRIYNPPTNAMNIYVVGKQWMWKAEHPGGQHEIDSLHVPIGQADPADADFAGCLSQLFDSGLSREARGDSGALHDGVVYADAAGNLSPVLYAVLRHAAFADDRRGHGDEAGRLQGVDGGLDQRHVAGAERRAAVRQPGLQCLPLRRRRERAVRTWQRSTDEGAADQRIVCDGGRRLPARLDSEPDDAHDGWLCADHADISGADQRRRTDRSGGIHQETQLQLSYSADAEHEPGAKPRCQTAHVRNRAQHRRQQRRGW